MHVGKRPHGEPVEVLPRGLSPWSWSAPIDQPAASSSRRHRPGELSRALTRMHVGKPATWEPVEVLSGRSRKAFLKK